MTAYRVTILHDACTTHDVDAETEAGAIEAAMDEAGVTLCHHCAGELEVGDPARAVCIENLETGESNMDVGLDREVAQLRARVAELEAQLSAPNAVFSGAGATEHQDDGAK